MNVTEQRLETRAVELEKQLDAANAQITGLKAWIMAANQFAWAHEKGCPRYTRDAPCNCGLDQFLGRPRPFIESYKQQLDAANRRIKEMTYYTGLAEQHWKECDQRVEEAERKLATLTDQNEELKACIRSAALNYHGRGNCWCHPSNQDGPHEPHCMWIQGKLADIEAQALAQIEQPQLDKQLITNIGADNIQPRDMPSPATLSDEREAHGLEALARRHHQP